MSSNQRPLNLGRRVLIPTDLFINCNDRPKIPQKPSKNLATNKKPLTKNLVSD